MRAERWRPPSLARPRPLEAVRVWLRREGSLTRALQERCADGFRVELLGLDWVAARSDEADVLGVSTGRRVLQRRVFLRCGNVPWVFARTVIPRKTLEGPGRRLRHLGGRSLGEVLFSGPFVERGVVEWARVAAADLLLPQEWGWLWGRRIHYRYHGRPLLVSEFFLPTLWAGARNDEPCPHSSPVSVSKTICA